MVWYDKINSSVKPSALASPSASWANRLNNTILQQTRQLKSQTVQPPQPFTFQTTGNMGVGSNTPQANIQPMFNFSAVLSDAKNKITTFTSSLGDEKRRTEANKRGEDLVKNMQKGFVEFGKEVLRATPRAAASAILTATKQKEFTPGVGTTPTAGKVEKFLYGDRPVKDIKGTGEQTIMDFGGSRETAIKWGLPLGLVLTSLDLWPGIPKKKIAETLAKESNPKLIEKILKAGVFKDLSDDVAESLAKRIASLKKADEVQAELDLFSKNGFNVTEEAAGGIKASQPPAQKLSSGLLKQEGLKQPEPILRRETSPLKGIISQKPKAPDDVLDSVRETLYKGQNQQARQLYEEIAKDFEIPPFENLTKELDQLEASVLREGGYSPFSQYGDYQDVAKKMQNFLKTKAEVKSKVSGELYREHIPRKVFGVSSDEISSALGISESEFMTKILPEVAGGKATPQVLKVFGQKLQRIKELAEALKLDKDFYKVIEGFDPTKLVTIPSYKKIRPYRAPGAVSIEPTEKTIAKIAERENLASVKAQEQLFREWQNSYRSETLTRSQRIGQIEKQIKQVTNEGINDKLKQNAGDVTILDYARTPENVFKKLGLSEPFDELRKASDSYENELTKEIEKIGDWFKQVKHIKGSEKRIFDYLDGTLVELSQTELKVAREIKDYLAKLADRQGLVEDKRITDYITHIFEPELGKQQIPPELLHALEYATPRGVFNPFLEKRLGASGYIHDVWRALDAYTAKSLRKIHLDKPIDNFGEYVEHLPDGAQQYTKGFLNYVVGRPDKFESLMDQTFKAIGKTVPNETIKRFMAVRPTQKIFGAARMAIYRGALGLNVGSALKNLTQVINTFSEEGPTATMKGYMSLLNPTNLKEVEKANLMKEIITAEHRMKPLRSAIEKMDKVLFVFFDMAERINRTAAYFAAKSNAVERGLPEEKAIEQALRKVRKTQFAYGKLDTPLMLQNPVLKTAFQFSTFPIKQAELLGGYVKNKQYGRILSYVMASFGVTWAVGDMIGMDYKDALIKNIFPTLGPAPSLVSSMVEVLKTESEDRRRQALAEFKKTSLLFVPAGVQAKKTAEGIGAFEQGASTTPAGRTRFEIEKTWQNRLKTAIFGQYSVPEAEKYFDNLGKSKSELIYKEITKLETNKQRIEAWNRMVDDGVITEGNAGDVKRWFEDEELKVTDEERRIRKLPVEDRARVILKEINKIETNKDRVAYVEDLQKKEIATDKVIAQLEVLLEKTNKAEEETVKPLDESLNGLVQSVFPDDQRQNIARVLVKENPKHDIRVENTNTNGTIDRGLMQINSKTFEDFMRRKGDLLKNEGINSFEDMFDPLKNLKMAKIIWDEQGWKAWFGAPADLRE